MMDIRTTEGLKNLLQAVIGVTFTVELCGTLLLFILLRHDIPHFGERLWWSLFHAVSAFCNAGFSLAPNNLESFVSRPMISFVFMFLITLGGLGFFVIGNIFNRKTWQVLHPIAVWSRFHTQTKIVLVATCVLNLFGMILFLFLEYDGVLFSLSLPEKLNAAIFEAVTLRTAGFTLVPQANLQLATVIFCVMWMFIGASPGSTGGGIKTTTMAVALLAVKSMLRGREDVDIFNRRVSPATVSRSLSIVLIATGIVVVFLMFLASTQSLSFERLLFESVSAFGTVGLSMNATEELNSVGRLLIIVLMFVGRIGPLTLALAVGERRFVKGVRLPEGRIAVG